jgi:hypothetical protein
MKSAATFSLLSFLAVFNFACSTSSAIANKESSYQASAQTIEYKDYRDVVEKFTKGDKLYDGFVLKFEYHASLLTTVLTDAQISLTAQDLQWTQSKVAAEREKHTSEASRETKIFLSFFTPENENDNLETTNSIWKVFLITEGSKIEGKVIRTGGLMADLQKKYPEHTRFNTPYQVTFPIPMTQVQQTTSRFVITGHLGTSEVAFPSITQ